VNHRKMHRLDIDPGYRIEWARVGDRWQAIWRSSRGWSVSSVAEPTRRAALADLLRRLEVSARVPSRRIAAARFLLT